jgi:hypothetical protein
MNPYFMEYLHNSEYSHSPLTDPAFVASAGLTGLTVFGVPGFLLGLVGGEASARVAKVVLACAIVASVLLHWPWSWPAMKGVYAVDLAWAILSFVVLWFLAARGRESMPGGPTRG